MITAEEKETLISLVWWVAYHIYHLSNSGRDQGVGYSDLSVSSFRLGL
jgi:hypothetical protein